MKKIEVHIIGAGFSGLSTAYYLSKLNKFNITVYEKNSRSGGMIHTFQDQAFMAEEAASSILLTDRMQEFLDEIQAPYIKPFSSSKKRFFFNQKMTRWPLSLSETCCFIFRFFISKVSGKLNRAQDNESLADWAKPRIGQPATDLILSPALQGIYAVSADKINAQLFLKVLRFKSGKYQGIVSGNKGMSDIIKSIEDACIKNNVIFKFNTNYNIQSENSETIKIFCTKAYEAANVLKQHHSSLSEQLEKINYTDVAAVTSQCSGKEDKQKGFGCVVAKNSVIDCLGILFNSDIFANRTPYSNETFIFGQQSAASTNQLSFDQLKNKILSIRKIVFGFSKGRENMIYKIHQKYWPKGLPIYDTNLHNFQKKLSLPNHIYLNGNYLTGIGLSHIINNSYNISLDLNRKYS